MNKIVEVIRVPDDIVNYMEVLAYEVESKKDIIAEMINTERIHSQAFKEYEKEYEKIFVTYKAAQEELYTKYIVNNPKCVGRNVTWNFLYKTKEFTITENVDEKGCAHC